MGIRSMKDEVPNTEGKMSSRAPSIILESNQSFKQVKPLSVNGLY